MKRLLATAITLTLVLTGCSSMKEVTTATEQEITTEETTQDVTQEDTQEDIQEDTQEAADDGTSVLSDLPEYFSFSSGAGAWSTDLYIAEDGSFSGVYHDSDMGDSGDSYPNGTIYVCNFSGKFTTPEKIDEYTYSMRIESIDLENEPGEKIYEDDLRYVYSEPYGLDNAEEILLYLPGAKVADLPEGFLSWTYVYFDSEITDTLPIYGLYNVSGDEGFVGSVE